MSKQWRVDTGAGGPGADHLQRNAKAIFSHIFGLLRGGANFSIKKVPPRKYSTSTLLDCRGKKLTEMMKFAITVGKLFNISDFCVQEEGIKRIEADHITVTIWSQYGHNTITK